MSKHKPKVNLFQVQNDPSSITAVAQTVSAAFSSDPLIQWLHPNVTPSTQLDASARKWQFRRTQRVISRGWVLRSASVGQMASELPRRSRKSESSDNSIRLASEKPTQIPGSGQPEVISSQEDAGAVVFLFPSKGYREWPFVSLWLACKLWLLEIFSPAHDKACKKERVGELLAASHAGRKALQAKYSARRLWYLEVIAVHPSLQSCGLGSGVMRSVLELVADNPIYLECTQKDNIRFYESFGFRVAEEVELIDHTESQNDGKSRYWVMVRSDDDP